MREAPHAPHAEWCASGVWGWDGVSIEYVGSSAVHTRAAVGVDGMDTASKEGMKEKNRQGKTEHQARQQEEYPKVQEENL